jgi:hypothetical protein
VRRILPCHCPSGVVLAGMKCGSAFWFGCATVLVLTAVPLSAHDFWLGSSNWFPEPGSTFAISAGVGERFPTRLDFKTPANWFDDWRVIGPSGEVPLSRKFDRRDLAMVADVTLPATGAFLAVMKVAPRTIDMKADEFDDYLKEEGLMDALAEWRGLRQTSQSVKERYSRYAKLAIRNGDGTAAHLTRPVGVKAELVPAADPTSLRSGETFTLQLLVDGRPVPNAAVFAAVDGGSFPRQTDAAGRVTFTIDREGEWLVKAVHMKRLSKTFPPGPDWESYWITLAFRVGRG